MKVAIVCHDHKLSGANMSLIDWIKDIDFKEVEIIVVIPRYNEEIITKFKKIGVKKIIIGHYCAKIKILHKIDKKQKIKEFIKYIYSNTLNHLFQYILYLKLKKEKIQLIHSNSFAVLIGAKIAKKMNVPHIWHIREFMEEDHQITHYNKSKLHKLCEISNAIFISDVIKEKYSKLYNFNNEVVIYNKIKYDQNYHKTRKFMEDDSCNIIIVGTLSQKKGQLDAIKAIQQINNNYKIHLYVCGIGPEEKKLKLFVEENNINNVSFLGHRSDIENLRKNMDISLMCSENEALGRVTIEAQYYENLVIGANCGCTPYLIKQEDTGLLYNRDSIEDLSNKIIWCILNKKETNLIINRAKKIAIKNFSKPISNKIINYYNKVIEVKKDE